jgi:hypothetical protein
MAAGHGAEGQNIGSLVWPLAMVLKVRTSALRYDRWPWCWRSELWNTRTVWTLALVLTVRSSEHQYDRWPWCWRSELRSMTAGHSAEIYVFILVCFHRAFYTSPKFSFSWSYISVSLIINGWSSYQGVLQNWSDWINIFVSSNSYVFYILNYLSGQGVCSGCAVLMACYDG